MKTFLLVILLPIVAIDARRLEGKDRYKRDNNGPTQAAVNCKTTELGLEFRGNIAVTSSNLQCQRWDSQSPHNHTSATPDRFPDDTVSAAENYCRNPTKSSGGPWCYTTDPNTRWEFCEIPDCLSTTQDSVQTEAPTQALTMAPTKAPTQASTEAPTQTPTQAKGTTQPVLTSRSQHNHHSHHHGHFSSTKHTQAPAQASTQPLTQTSTQAPPKRTTQPVLTSRSQHNHHSHHHGHFSSTKHTQAPAQASTQSLTLGPTQAHSEAPTQAPVNCKTTEGGLEFRGNIAVTSSNLQCQRWDSQSPHNHTSTTPDQFPDDTVSAAENYCRNPTKSSGGPWCYTTDPNTRWELCDVPMC